jgi:hypothetical protein
MGLSYKMYIQPKTINDVFLDVYVINRETALSYLKTIYPHLTGDHKLHAENVLKQYLDKELINVH